MATGKLHKKKSKRLSCRRRYKIEKKVREHKRKLNKEAKQKAKKTGGLSKKPDVQVPNKAPFKADVLREAEQRKQRAEELKAKQKVDRQKQIEKRRNLESLVKDAEKRGKQHEASKKLTDVATNKDENAKETDKSGLVSLKAYYSEVKKVVELSDVVLEVLDARDPLGSRSTAVEESVLVAGKRLVLLLNKIDLVPKSNVEHWLKYLRRQLPTVAFKASTQEQQRSLGRAGHAFVNTSKCIGADILMRMLGNYCRNKDIKTSIRVGIVGFPNVGKSSVINSLKRKVTCNVGATPGVTRAIQEVHLDKKIRLLDSPGVVVASSAFDPVEMALKNAIRVECLADPVSVVEGVVRRCQKTALMLQYNLPEFEDTTELLGMLARKMGRLKKGGVPDTKAAAKKLLTDWNQGKLRYYTVPPEDPSDGSTGADYISSELVTEMGKEFDLEAIDADQKLLIDGLPPNPLMETDAIVLPARPIESGTDQQEMGDEEGDADQAGDEDEEGWMDVDTESTSTKVKTDPPSRKSRAASPDRPVEDEPLMRLEGNRQANKMMKKAAKKNKKKVKRTEKLATNLSNAMDQALASFSIGSGKKKAGDDYDFDEHFE